MSDRRSPWTSRASVRYATLLLWGLLAWACAEAPEGKKSDDTVELVGRFEAYVVHHADGSSREAHALKLDSGERVELVFEEQLELSSGERVALRGRYVSNAKPLSEQDDLRLGSTRFRVERAVARGSIERAAQALVSPPKVTVKQAVVLLNFNGFPPQSYTVEDARRELAEVKEYYEEISYGSWFMETDVFGPYSVDPPSECNLDVLGELAKATAREHGVNIDAYEHVGVKIEGMPGKTCPCAVAHLGIPPSLRALENGGVSLYGTCAGANAYAHEMGHGIGLHHSGTAPCNGVAYRPGLEGCELREYGNRYNTMGGGLGHFNAVQKATLGWLNGCNVRRVSADGEFDLTAIQLGVDDATQALQIDTGDTRNGQPLYFYVEYRNPSLAKFNALKEDGQPRERGPGLHVTVSRDFRSPRGEGRTFLIDASNGLKGLPKDGSDADQASGDPRLLEGETFQPNDKVTIEFISRTENVARVKVSFAGGGSGTNECQPLERPLLPEDVPAGYAAVLYQNCAYWGWAVNLTEGRYTVAELQALGAVNDDASSILLARGYEAILYEDDNFEGRSVVLSKSRACLSGIGFNDILSSIEIVYTGVVPSEDAGTGDPDAGVSGSDEDSGAGSGGDDGVEADAGEPGDDNGVGSGADSDNADGALGGGSGQDDTTPPARRGGCSVGAGAAGLSMWPSFGALLFAFALRRRRGVKNAA